MIGLVLDGEGFPKAHEVFTGNTKDENSMTQMLDSLDRRSGSIAGWPSQPTVIMDRRLPTDENLNLLRKRGQHYIVATQHSEHHELFPEIDDDVLNLTFSRGYSVAEYVLRPRRSQPVPTR